MAKSQFPYYNFDPSETNNQIQNIMPTGINFANYSIYSNIPGNKPASNGNTIPTQQLEQSQRTSSFTDSSSSALDDDIIFLGENIGKKRIYDPPAENPHKFNKLHDASDVPNTNVKIAPSPCTGIKVENPFPPLPKPIIAESLINYYPYQDKSNFSVTSPVRNGTIVKVTLRSPKKLPSDQKAITQYCKQEAAQINNNITNCQMSVNTPFVDPTYDVAFKYLFSKLELAKHFIHSVLELNTVNITSLKPINVHLSELQQESQCNQSQAALAVDGLFKVKTDDSQNHKMLVFLEMQRKNFPGFLTREQIYSALIATNAVKKGVSKHYDKIPKVVGIIITLKNVLPKDVPYCSRISTKVQSKDGELMNVQFSSLTDMHVFELEKFQKHPESLSINKYSSSSLQWLNFLLKCGQVKSIPDDASDIIKLAYNHMTRVNMPLQDLILINASQIKAQLEEQARNQQLIDAERQGKIKSAIQTIQSLSKVPNINDDIIIQSVSAQLQPDQVRNTLQYIRSHKNSDNINDVINACNLLGDNNIEGDEYGNDILGLTHEESSEQIFN